MSNISGRDLLVLAGMLVLTSETNAAIQKIPAASYCARYSVAPSYWQQPDFARCRVFGMELGASGWKPGLAPDAAFGHHPPGTWGLIKRVVGKPLKRRIFQPHGKNLPRNIDQPHGVAETCHPIAARVITGSNPQHGGELEEVSSTICIGSVLRNPSHM